MITLTNGHVQTPAGLIVPNGAIAMQLNIDGTVIAAPGGIVMANEVVVFQFDSSGNIQSGAQIYSNKELQPQNSLGLGTYYLVTFYDPNGARLNKNPMWWQFSEAAGATVDISTMTPYGVIGGNVIFYPLPSGGTVSSVAFAGDGTVLSATPSAPVITSGVISATLLTQNANLFLAGPASGPSANPTFRAITASDFPAGTGVPAGATTQLQYNNGGIFGASANLTWLNASNLLTVGGLVSITGTGVSGFTNVLQVSAPANSSESPVMFGPFNDNTITFDGVVAISNYTGSVTNSSGAHYAVNIRANSLATGGVYGHLGGLRLDVDANSSAGGTITTLYGIDAHINSGTGSAQVNYITFSSTFDGTSDATTGYHFRAQNTASGAATDLWGFYSDNAPSLLGGNLQTNGLALALKTVVANYQPTVNDCVILANGTITITLPTSQPGGPSFVNIYPHVFPVGMMYRVKNISTGTVTVVPQTGTIDGAASYSLGLNSSADFHWDGTNYWVF